MRLFPTAAARRFPSAAPGAPPHAGAVKSGKRTVSIHLFALAALSAAALAGRVGEDGTGTLWIAPELIASATPLADACAFPARTQPVELRFEMLHPDDIDSHAPLLAGLTNDHREVVDFDWNPATSELQFRAASGSQVFSDLALPATGEMAQARCGSH